VTCLLPKKNGFVFSQPSQKTKYYSFSECAFHKVRSKIINIDLMSLYDPSTKQKATQTNMIVLLLYFQSMHGIKFSISMVELSYNIFVDEWIKLKHQLLYNGYDSCTQILQ